MTPPNKIKSASAPCFSASIEVSRSFLIDIGAQKLFQARAHQFHAKSMPIFDANSAPNRGIAELQNHQVQTLAASNQEKCIVLLNRSTNRFVHR
jgi:hypothetical protein